MRQYLDALYKTSGVAAAFCLIAILCVIVMQMAARWMLLPFPGSSEYAGYLMAASSFLAFPYTLNSNSHIRVTLFIKALGTKRYWGELWCFGIGALTTSFMAYYACKLIYWSVRFGDISQGQDAMPLWLVQLPVAFGAILLAICFWDNFVSLIVTRKDNIIGEKLEGPEV